MGMIFPYSLRTTSKYPKQLNAKPEAKNPRQPTTEKERLGLARAMLQASFMVLGYGDGRGNNWWPPY